MILEVLFEKRNMHAACQLKDLKLAPEYQNKMLHNIILEPIVVKLNFHSSCVLT